MATIASLAGLMGGSDAGAMTPAAPQSIDSGTGSGGGIGLGGTGAGGSAQDGLGQVNSGASTIASAIGQAQNALGSGGGGSMAIEGNKAFKKGGSVKKNYTNGGKINLDACGVSTSSKGKKNSGW